MEYRKLGSTDIDISAVAMGCWPIVGGSTWGEQDEAQSVATIHAALDAGITFFDTAEAYGAGHSESLLGRELGARRREVVIASKVNGDHLRPDDLRKSCEQSLRRLKTDTIDLYQIHWPSRHVPLADTMGALEKLKREGKVRAIGVSNFGVRDLSELLEISPCVTNQLPYNLLWRAVEFEIQPLCVENSVGILCYSPLMQGLLTGKFKSPDDVPEGRARTRHFSCDRPQSRHGEPGFEAETFATVEGIGRICDDIQQPMADVALAWLLHRPGVTCVLAGARRPEQIRENARAGDLKLSDEIINELNATTDELKEKLGPNPDVWQSESRFR